MYVNGLLRAPRFSVISLSMHLTSPWQFNATNNIDKENFRTTLTSKLLMKDYPSLGLYEKVNFVWQPNYKSAFLSVLDSFYLVQKGSCPFWYPNGFLDDRTADSSSSKGFSTWRYFQIQIDLHECMFCSQFRLYNKPFTLIYIRQLKAPFSPHMSQFFLLKTWHDLTSQFVLVFMLGSHRNWSPSRATK